MPGQRLDNVNIACVPLNSPLLNSKGQRLIGQDQEEQSQGFKRLVELDIQTTNATKDDLFGYGVAAKITGVEGGRGTGGDLTLLVEGVARVRIDKITQERPFFEGDVTYLYDEPISPEDAAAQELFAHLKTLSRELLALLRLSSLLPRSSGTSGLSPMVARRLGMFIAKKSIQDAGNLADFMTNIVEATREEKLEVLAALNIKDRLEKAIALLQRQVGNIKSNVNIATFTSTSIPAKIDLDPALNSAQRALARRAGMTLPGGRDEEQEPNDLDELKKRLDDAKLTPDAAKVADREWKRLKKMSPMQAEFQVMLNYLEILAEIPWSAMTEDQLGLETLSRARKQLDDDHYGLEKVKKRLLEYLAVLKLKQSINAGVNADIAKAEEEKSIEKLEILKSKRMVDKSPILLLVGPPGVGKTSLAKSVATALGRKFHRISLGGVRDEAEIRGHRRTYVAAMPGLIVSALRKVGVSNPVILLDEIDKVG